MVWAVCAFAHRPLFGVDVLYPQLTYLGSWLAVHACFMVRGDLFVDCIYDKQVWDKRKILNQQWVHPCLLHSQGGLFVYCIYVYQLWYKGKTSLMWSWWWKASFAPFGPFSFLFFLVQCLCFTLNWVSKGFWCYDCLTLQTTLSYHQWLLIADSTKVVSALLALSGRDNVGTPFERV